MWNEGSTLEKVILVFTFIYDLFFNVAIYISHFTLNLKMISNLEMITVKRLVAIMWNEIWILDKVQTIIIYALLCVNLVIFIVPKAEYYR